MLVSQFELVYKPQAPIGPADTVLQGYFLKITNLESRAFEFGLNFATSAVTNPNRSFFARALVLVDTPDGLNNGVYPYSGGPLSERFLLNETIPIPAGGTALVAVLPTDAFPPTQVAPSSADYECRGFVTLTLPARRFRPQSSTPVRVLLTAQNRAVFLDQVSGDPKGQAQASVPLASGKAENEVEPEGILFTNPFRPVPDVLRDFDLSRNAHFFSINSLQAMLSAVSEAELDVKDLNQALKSAGIGFTLQKRKD